MTDTVQKDLSHVRSLLEKGEHQDAIDFARKIIQDCHENENRIFAVDGYILTAEACWRSSQLDEGLTAVEEGTDLILAVKRELGIMDEIEFLQREAQLLQQEGVIRWYKGDLEAALECHQQCLGIRQKHQDTQGIAASLNNLGLVYLAKGDHDEALDHYQLSLNLTEDMGDEEAISRAINNIAGVYHSKGDLEKALDFSLRSLEIKEGIGKKLDIAMALNNVGVICQLQGDLDKALDYYKKSLAVQEELPIGLEFALALNNLGEIYQLKGELDIALQFYERGLTIYKEKGFKQETAMAFSNIGAIYRKKRDYTRSLEFHTQSLALYEELGNDRMRAVLLFELVWNSLDENDIDAAQSYLMKLEQIDNRTDNPRISQHYRIAKAKILGASKRARDKLEAQSILETVVDEDVTDHSLTVVAMMNLCDLLLFELSLTGEEEVLTKIQTLTYQLLDIAERYASHSLLVEIYLLQSRFALVELDIERAANLLTRAHTLAEEKGLDRLARMAAQDQESLQSQLNKWESIIKKNPARQDSVDLSKMDKLVELMVRRTVATIGLKGRNRSAEKYKLVHRNLLKDSQKTERSQFRVGIAQIGLSRSGDILSEMYEEKGVGLLGIKEDAIDGLRSKMKEMIEVAHSQGVNILLFPEMTIDLNYSRLLDDVIKLAKDYQMYLIPGSSHEERTKQNVCRVVGPEGVLWEQTKHIPASIRIGEKRFREGIEIETFPQEILICTTEFGRIAVTICRDFLDMDLRVMLKNSKPPVDIVLNPAFTPVTADFKAAHFDARRSIYAYLFFANVAEFGDSLIYSPERDREERTIKKGEENLIYKDVDLFQLRSERKKWEEQRKKKSFIQSTR